MGGYDGILTPDAFHKRVLDAAAELAWLVHEGQPAYRWSHSGLGFPKGGDGRTSGVADPTASEAAGSDVAKLREVRAALETIYARLREVRRLLESPRSDVADRGGGWVSGEERARLLAAQQRRRARGADYGEG